MAPKRANLQSQKTTRFTFDAQVAEVFEDMIRRSVPGYASMLSMIELLARRFAKPNSRLYDLGCSLGAASWLMRRVVDPSCVIHAVDNSAAMLQRMRGVLHQSQHEVSNACPVEVHMGDVRDYPITEASLVVLNLTLQFLPLADRWPLLQRIHDGMLPGGALILSEKIRFDDPDEQTLQTELHHDFKRTNGYSDLEIAEKRDAIEDFLIPETLATHLNRLRELGFQRVSPWLQHFNFVSILAVK